MGERGISLLEVMVVLIVLSIFGGISFSVGASALDNYKLDRSAQILVSDLREAREKALDENVWQEVKLFSSTNSYRLLRSGVPQQDVVLDNGVVLKSGNLDISFYPSGSPSVGATIILANKRGKELKVIIAPVTGRVRLLS